MPLAVLHEIYGEPVLRGYPLRHLHNDCAQLDGSVMALRAPVIQLPNGALRPIIDSNRVDKLTKIPTNVTIDHTEGVSRVTVATDNTPFERPILHYNDTRAEASYYGTRTSLNENFLSLTLTVQAAGQAALTGRNQAGDERTLLGITNAELSLFSYALCLAIKLRSDTHSSAN